MDCQLAQSSAKAEEKEAIIHKYRAHPFPSEGCEGIRFCEHIAADAPTTGELGVLSLFAQNKPASSAFAKGTWKAIVSKRRDSQHVSSKRLCRGYDGLLSQITIATTAARIKNAIVHAANQF
jgi:hypothetical protein